MGKRKVVTIGNSAAVTISPAQLRALGLHTGDPVEVTVHAGVLEVRPVSKYEGMDLDSLMNVIDQRRTRS